MEVFSQKWQLYNDWAGNPSFHMYRNRRLCGFSCWADHADDCYHVLMLELLNRSFKCKSKEKAWQQNHIVHIDWQRRAYDSAYHPTQLTRSQRVTKHPSCTAGKTIAWNDIVYIRHCVCFMLGQKNIFFLITDLDCHVDLEGVKGQSKWLRGVLRGNGMPPYFSCKCSTLWQMVALKDKRKPASTEY